MKCVRFVFWEADEYGAPMFLEWLDQNFQRVKYKSACVVFGPRGMGVEYQLVEA